MPLRDKKCTVLGSAIKLLTILSVRGKGVWGWNFARKKIVQVIHSLKRSSNRNIDFACILNVNKNTALAEQIFSSGLTPLYVISFIIFTSLAQMVHVW